VPQSNLWESVAREPKSELKFSFNKTIEWRFPAVRLQCQRTDSLQLYLEQ